MIERDRYKTVEKALGRQAVVAILGPRQVGKTTLALQIAASRPYVYLDLESSLDRDKIRNFPLFCQQNQDTLIILDEIHRAPELFQELRGIVDGDRRAGKGIGRFLILGSASLDLMHQSGESLAGRIEYVPLTPLSVLEVSRDPITLCQLWLRGGFPGSFLANSDEDSLVARWNFITTYLGRDIPSFGIRVPGQTLERFWTMLAHLQGSPLNASNLSSSLGVSPPTISNYVDLLVDLLLVRRLAPWHGNLKKRLVKSPKVYIRDSGLAHALLHIPTMNDLLGHPILGHSWEGFVIENILNYVPVGTLASYYRTAAGAEVDLVLELGGRHGTWVIEIKQGSTPTLSKGFYSALEDIKPTKTFVVYPGEDRYPKAEAIDAIPLTELLLILRNLVN